MFFRVISTILGFGSLSILASDIIENKTFEWIYLPAGWACTIFIVYGLFGVNLTQIESNLDSANDVEHNKSDQ